MYLIKELVIIIKYFTFILMLKSSSKSIAIVALLYGKEAVQAIKESESLASYNQELLEADIDADIDMSVYEDMAEAYKYFPERARIAEKVNGADLIAPQ